MNSRKFYILGSISAIVAAGALLFIPTEAQAQAANGEDMQVLTRGPVHEAFAEAVSLDPVEGIIIKATPPELIEELPPSHQLEGDNITWISGYWAWDDERNDFIWVSGIWRNVPPDRQWVPGYWNDIGDGQYQWTPGYWADAQVEELAYVPTAPPRSLEVGPNIPAPSAEHSWVPGNWSYVNTSYNWSPGYWVGYRPNWTWVPARYIWTRRGYIYVDGYWDYAVARRGMLFAPVYYNRPIYTTPDYYYTPAIVVALSVFADHLFIRPRHCHYYFGDYYAPRYRSSGFYASYYWHSSRGGYDPIYAYQRWDHRRDSGWESRRHRDYEYFRDNEHARPPRTWAAMRDSRDDRFDDRRNRRFAESLESVVAKPTEGQRFRTLDESRRESYVAQSREVRKFSGERRNLETRSLATADRTTTERAVVREKIKRSPITGRSADRFAKDEAPPARPVASRPARGKDTAEMRNDRRTEATPQRRTEDSPQRRTEATPERRTGAERDGRTEATPQRRPEATPQRRPEVTPQRRPEATPQRRPEVTPQRRPEATPQSRPEATPQRRPEATPQRRPEVTPQRRPEATPQSRPQVTPQRRPEATPQRRPEATLQRRPEATPQRRPEATPQRRPQVTPQRRPEATPQSRPQATPQRRPEVTPQRRPEATPQRRPEATPQRRPEDEEKGRRNR